MAERCKEVVERLPENVKRQVEDYRTQYKNWTDAQVYTRINDVRVRMAGYVLGLRDAGLINEHERQMVFVYMTVKL